MGHIIIPAVMNELKQKTTGLEMNMTLLLGYHSRDIIFG
jgi:hypothetical protein